MSRTLPTRTVGDWVVFPDADDAGVAWVLRARPLAVGDLSLVLWNRLDAPTEGRLTVELSVGPSDTERADLPARLGVREVRALPMAGARVTLAVEADRATGSAVTIGDRVHLAVDLPALLADRVEALLTGTGTLAASVRWEIETWLQLPGGAVEVAADASLVGPLLDAGEAPPGLGGALSVTWSGTELDPAILLDWVWTELRARRADGRPLSFRANAGSLVCLPVALSTSLEGLGTPRIQHVDLGAETSLRTRRFEVRLAGDPARAGWTTVEARLTMGTTPRYGNPSPSLTWDLPLDASATWSWRALQTNGATEWAAEMPAVGVGWVAVPVPARRELVVSAVALDLEQRWERVEAALRWAGPTPESALLTLDKDHPVVRWVSAGEGAGALSVDLSYVATGGAVRTRTVTPGDTLVLDDPEAIDLRDVTVLFGGGGWSPETVAWIDVEHADGPAWRRQSVPMGRAGARAGIPREGGWRWRAHLRHPDGRYERTDWRPAAADVEVLTLPAPAGCRLQVLAVWFDQGFRSVDLVVQPTGGTPRTQTITSALPVDVVLDGALPASWEATWTAADGRTVHQAGTADRNVLVLPKP